MKKFIALVLAMTMVFSMAIVASAASTTTLTTTVPAATYTLNIPADQNVEFGTTKLNLGVVKVTDSEIFDLGKDLQVTVTYGDFTSSTTNTTIPFSLQECVSAYNTVRDLESGGYITFEGQSDGTVKQYSQMYCGNVVIDYNDVDQLLLKMDSNDWGKALAGEYSATITFTAEVVA